MTAPLTDLIAAMTAPRPVGPRPTEPPLEEHRPRRQRQPAPTSARELAAEAIGYVVAWGLILAVGMAACSAMLGPSSPVSAPSATVSAVAPSDTPAPTARRSVAPGRRTPAPSFDLNLVTIDCDPNDPQMDPIDEECPAP